MGLHPSSLLVLVLCLGQTVHMQNRALPRPSISVERDPVMCQGRPATIVCRGPAWADTFRLVEKGRASAYREEKFPSQHGSEWAEARFCIEAVSGVTARTYFCFYSKGFSWSEFSEPLELTVTEKDVFPPPSVPGTASEVTPPPTEVTLVPTEVSLVPTGPVSQTAPASQNYTVGNCVRMGLAGVVLLILVGILAEAGHSRHRWPHRPQEWTQVSSCQRN
ncbi:leukocyte-associated immunoglobulin-like receptor 2 isoform X1 [Artibeus jamaicensis]|uniref:leukocyte-associated immunoglobulin-like receptor 2 isoform X1 n=1 Tax=Artibeus jamaicensis TaxID=9417 RepID=UPI00235AE425|nr:leukocyte-associated immunoglobulin-like receptor 2 isoform X1 [Artibeus jamaicensis]